VEREKERRELEKEKERKFEVTGQTFKEPNVQKMLMCEVRWSGAGRRGGTQHAQNTETDRQTDRQKDRQTDR